MWDRGRHPTRRARSSQEETLRPDTGRRDDPHHRDFDQHAHHVGQRGADPNPNRLTVAATVSLKTLLAPMSAAEAAIHQATPNWRLSLAMT